MVILGTFALTRQILVLGDVLFVCEGLSGRGGGLVLENSILLEVRLRICSLDRLAVLLDPSRRQFDFEALDLLLKTVDFILHH